MKNSGRIDQRRKTTTAEYAANWIRSAILGGTYSTGQRLIEAEITDRLDVGRGPVREALRRLTTEGLVEIVPYRGAIVTRPTRSDVLGLIEAREAIESLGATLAAQRIDDAGNRSRAETALSALLDASCSAPDAEYMEENFTFHQFVSELSGNPHIGRLLSQLQLPPMQRSFFDLFSDSQREDSRHEHKNILMAILEGDPAKAENAMRRHIRHTATLLDQVPDAAFRPND